MTFCGERRKEAAHIAETTRSMAPEKQEEDLSMRRRRLKYRAAHRGTLELDMLIGTFAAAAADRMDEAELRRF